MFLFFVCSAWDGRLALVVTADIAEYAKGAARPTGGAAALAMLIGPNASIVLEPGMRASHMAHSYDFFKPHLSSPYPVVDGKGSAMCYLRSLDLCYARLCEKRKTLLGADTTVESFDYVVCHAPYNKLVQKSFGRLLYNDYARAPAGDARFASVPETLREVSREASYEHVELEKTFVGLSKSAYARMVRSRVRCCCSSLICECFVSSMGLFAILKTLCFSFSCHSLVS